MKNFFFALLFASLGLSAKASAPLPLAITRPDAYTTMYYGDKDGNGHYSFWTDYSVGTGSGSLSITSMGKAVIGDRFVIAPGTYTTSVIGGIHDVAIVNGQGTVTFTAQMNYGNNGDSMWNVALSGNGYAGAAQGIIFSNIKGDAIFSTDKHDRGLRFYNLAFQGITGNSISFAYSSSISGPQTTYNGTEPSLKVSGLTIANTVFNSCSLGVKGSYVVNPIDNTQVIDSFDFHGNTIANLTSPGNFVDGIWTHVNFYNNSITYAGRVLHSWLGAGAPQFHARRQRVLSKDIRDERSAECG